MISDAVTPEPMTPLLNDVVPGSVDFKGRPSVRSKSGIWRSTSFIICAGVAERFAYYGISSNLVSYLTIQMGQSTASAAANLNAWFGISTLLPIVGAFIADSFSGRFPMIVVSSLVYITGLCFLAISTLFTSSDKLRIIYFYFSFYLVAIAQGGFLPCIEAFGADQFDPEIEHESKARSSFFNWWTCIYAAGILVPLLCLTYIQDNASWFLGFGIPAIVMFVAQIVFLIGTPTYRLRLISHQRKPFMRIGQVFVRAARNWRAPNVVSIETQSSKFRFLDKALLNSNDLLEENIINATDVEDAKKLLSLAPIWITSLGYSIIFAQPSTLFTKQAVTLDRHITPAIEIPAASLQQCFINAVIMIGLILYDRAFVPIARSITKKPSGIPILHRIRFGFFLSMISIIFAAFVEQKRLRFVGEYDIPMSVWWLAPQYILSAFADVFAMVGLQEFFYSEVASDLKSIGLSFFISILGVGSLLSSFMVSSIQQVTSAGGGDGWFADDVNRAHFDFFYWLLAGISAACLTAFVIINRASTVPSTDDVPINQV